MNLRQKYKKLKQENERLKNRLDPFRPTVACDRREVVRLKVKKMYDKSLMGYVPEEVIKRDIEYLMGEAVMPYIRRSIVDIPDPNHDYMMVEVYLDVVKSGEEEIYGDERIQQVMANLRDHALCFSRGIQKFNDTITDELLPRVEAIRSKLQESGHELGHKED